MEPTNVNNRTEKPKYAASKQDLANGWLKIKGCMLQTFAHHFWLKHFKPHIGDNIDYELHEACHIVERGCLASVLLNIRVLNDFFDSGGYDTDIKACHYPNFTSPGAFLTADEDKSLNKHIVHLTKDRVEVASAVWCPLDLINRAISPFKLFAEYIRDEFLKGHDNLDEVISRDFEHVKVLLDDVQTDYGN